jgi:hypothetical protein
MSWIRSSLLQRNPRQRRKKRLLWRSPSRLTERRLPRLLPQRRIHLLRPSWLHLPRSQMRALLRLLQPLLNPTKRRHPSNLHNPLQLPSQPNQPQRNLSLLSLPLTRNILQPTPMPIHKPHTLMRHTTPLILAGTVILMLNINPCRPHIIPKLLPRRHTHPSQLCITT